ncbi:hypothetical protein ACIHCQ_24780 [Streptomyces sp. NPDC052236]|uniref:hypothetical protein n=1 Tax=Streptomyces sp. NPDC052236 TaxID=3365686 RepID=UPI0037D972D5
MGMSGFRRAGITLAAVAAIAGAAGCQSGSGGSGSSDGSSGSEGGKKAGAGVAAVSPIAALRTVDQQTDGAKSAKVDGTMMMGPTVSFTMNGALEWTDGVTGTVDMKYTGGTMADAMKKIGGDGTIKARYLSDAYYANMGDALAAQMGGKHWIRYGYEDLSKVMGAAGDVMKDQMQNTTPDKAVKALLASGDVKKVGEDDVRGVPTTHYSGTVDVAELTQKNSTLDAGQLQALKEQLTKAGITTEKVDIWVDKNDLLVKKTESGQLKTGAFNSTVFYSGYGTEVSAEAPPTADTIDFTKLIKQQAPAS